MHLFGSETHIMKNDCSLHYSPKSFQSCDKQTLQKTLVKRQARQQQLKLFWNYSLCCGKELPILVWSFNRGVDQNGSVWKNSINWKKEVIALTFAYCLPRLLANRCISICQLRCSSTFRTFTSLWLVVLPKWQEKIRSSAFATGSWTAFSLYSVCFNFLAQISGLILVPSVWNPSCQGDWRSHMLRIDCKNPV